MTFCKIFGYIQKDIIGLNISKLMPKLIAKFHTEFMKSNLEKQSISECSHAMNKISSVGLHKNGYIFPLFVKLLSGPNILNDMQYIAKIIVDKKTVSAEICHLLINNEKHVVGISSSCVSLLNITVNTLANYLIDIKRMIPELFPNSLLYGNFIKRDSMVKVYFPLSTNICQFLYYLSN